MSETLRFLREFVRRPHEVGAVAPSGRALAQMMVQGVGLDEARAVVEYGPGPGPITAALLEQLPRACVFFAIELNPVFAARLRERHPGLVVYNESVAEVRALAERLGLREVDCVVSGLPWASFPEAEQRLLLERTVAVLRPGGRFVTFAYLQGFLLPAAWRFRALLREFFPEVRRSPVVWRNLPPAFVWRCRR